MGYAFPLILAAIAAAALFAAALWWWKRRDALRNAGEIYEDWSRESPHALRGLSEAQFREAYMRVHGARGQAAIAIALAGVLLVTPIFLGVFRGLWNLIWDMSGRDPIYEEGVLVWMFALFFSMALVWALVAALVARLYHHRAAGSLREELIREEADAGAR